MCGTEAGKGSLVEPLPEEVYGMGADGMPTHPKCHSWEDTTCQGDYSVRGAATNLIYPS